MAAFRAVAAPLAASRGVAAVPVGGVFAVSARAAGVRSVLSSTRIGRRSLSEVARPRQRGGPPPRRTSARRESPRDVPTAVRGTVRDVARVLRDVPRPSVAADHMQVKAGDGLLGQVLQVGTAGATLRLTPVGVEPEHAHAASVGLLHAKDCAFEELVVGEVRPVWVLGVLEDGRIDLALRPYGKRTAVEIRQALQKRLVEAGGFLPFDSTSPAAVVLDTFGVSKTQFKRALGFLIKRGTVVLEEGGMKFVPKSDRQSWPLSRKKAADGRRAVVANQLGDTYGGYTTSRKPKHLLVANADGVAKRVHRQLSDGADAIAAEASGDSGVRFLSEEDTVGVVDEADAMAAPELRQKEPYYVQHEDDDVTDADER